MAYQDTFRMESQLWLNAHPNMQKLSNTMSTFTGILQTGLAVTNAMNLATLVTQGQSSMMMQLKAQESQLQRELNLAIQQYGEGSLEAAAIEEELGVTKQRIIELGKQEQAQWISNAVTMGISMAMIGSSIIQAIPKIAALTANLKLTTLGFITLSPAVNTATASLTGFGVAVSLAAASLALIAGFFVGTELRENNRSFLETLQNDWHNFVNGQIVLGNDWIGHLTIDLPAAFEATRLAFFSLWVGMISITNAAGMAIVGGINSAVAAVVNAVNTIIHSINSAAGFTGISIPTIAFSPVAFATIPMISAATGFEGRLSQDTMFQAHKGEHVSITPAGGGSAGGGGGTTIIYNIAGSLWSYGELRDMLDEDRQRAQRDRM